MANVHAVSAGWTAGDISPLLAVATAAALDVCVDDKLAAAPLHAMHALLRLGRPVLAANPTVAAAMAARAAKTNTCAPGAGNGNDVEFVCDLVVPTIEALLCQIGPAAVPHLQAELRAFTNTSPLVSLSDLGLDTVASALLNILAESKDGPGLITVAGELVNLLEGYLDKWDARMAPRPLLQGLIREAVASLEKCVAWARSERTLRALRRVRELPGDNSVAANSWACVLYVAGVEPHPRDPLCADTHPAPGATEVRAMWEWSHPGQRASSAVISGPFPGEPGYQLSSHWYLAPCCSNAMCGIDLKPPAPGVVVDPMSVMAAMMQAIDSKYRPAQLQKNAACGKCRTLAFCGPACQKVSWRAPHPVLEWTTASADVKACVALRRIVAGTGIQDHANVCALLAVEVARADAGAIL